MQRLAKVLAIGAALTGLGLVVAGTALTDSAGPSVRDAHCGATSPGRTSASNSSRLHTNRRRY